MPEFGSALFAAAATTKSLRQIAPHSKSLLAKSSPKLERAHSSTTLSDAILASYTSRKSTDNRLKKISEVTVSDAKIFIFDIVKFSIVKSWYHLMCWSASATCYSCIHIRKICELFSFPCECFVSMCRFSLAVL